ncbi:hypothetical protein DERP_008131 [Dermatophagoides pteronyssinus]|uniref:Uncharacterized protein n=1 Tax=Dermatophagoides pteronyssinus TaxID=6956 RepID=A0ABQ8JKA0_DERPT|nr:hypothetical protein DERP_008131 [Dermatophagoides pteronyssinus]
MKLKLEDKMIRTSSFFLISEDFMIQNQMNCCLNNGSFLSKSMDDSATLTISFSYLSLIVRV